VDVSFTWKPVTEDAEYVSPDFVSVSTLDEELDDDPDPPPQADNINARGVVASAALFLFALNFSENSPNTEAVPACKLNDFAFESCTIFSSLNINWYALQKKRD